MNTRTTITLLAFATATLLVAPSRARAEADLFGRPHVHRPIQYDPLSRARGGGPGHRIYPERYDGVRRWYGGRGDDRWRWQNDPTPGWSDWPVPTGPAGFGWRF